MNNEVSLEEMLKARELRSAKRLALIREYATPVITFTMNIAGPVKTNEYIIRAFDAGYSELVSRLSEADASILYKETFYEKCGCLALIAADFDEIDLKKICIEIEENHPLGRLFDMDVVGTDGNAIASDGLRTTGRDCIVCGAPGRACASRRLHSVEELQKRTREIISDYFLDIDSARVASLVCSCLNDEVLTTPKPGLVDKNNNGSHKDMDIDKFMASSEALQPYFSLFFKEGASGETDNLFAGLRRIGLSAESVMFKATGGVNTHKGAIFIFGLVCGALGRLWTITGINANVEEICQMCSSISGPVLRAELESIASEKDTSTHGAAAYTENGVEGARGQAINGFPAVRLISLPMFRQLKEAGMDTCRAGSICLLHLIANVYDTNMISRSNFTEVTNVMDKIRTYLHCDHRPSIDEIRKMDDYFIKANLSPGGAADLLSLTYFFYKLENTNHDQTD